MDPRAPRRVPTGAQAHRGVWFTVDWIGAMAVDRACYRVGLRAPIVGVWHREGLGLGHVLRHTYECFVVITMAGFEALTHDEPDLWTHKWTPGNRTTGHSAEKPIPLLARAIRLLTRPGGIVLDPFSGSGSTGVAALREGMRYIGLERDDEWASFQRERLRAEQQLTTVAAARAGQVPLLDISGAQP